MARRELDVYPDVCDCELQLVHEDREELVEELAEEACGVPLGLSESGACGAREGGDDRLIGGGGAVRKVGEVDNEA